ncbi:MAG: VWA domain-containing protein [Vicinamibacteria bacterium]|nr:VWA domain-containing protein [Vicinamibacteria bacterium]
MLRRVMPAAVLAAIVLPAAAWAQVPALEPLVISSPAEGSYITGPVLLQVRAKAPGEVRVVTFFADGRSVCTVLLPPFECNWDAGAGLKEHVVRAVATLADGARLVATSRTRSAGYIEAVEVEVVQVTATVVDNQRRFVKGLTKDQFRVKEDGVLQRLTAFAGENVPLEIVVAVDVSHSMTEAMPTLKAAVRTFLTALRPADQVTLLAFNDNIFTLARRATEPALRVRAVERLAPWGGTALFDAMLTALNTVGKQPGRRALVVFSDGEDQNSVATLTRVETRLETSDATIYTIGLGRSVKDKDLAQVMARMSQMSGGRSFLLDDINELEKVFADIVEELSNQYLLSYASSNDAHDGNLRKILVELPAQKHQVRHRQGYRAAGGKKKP